ncbi:DUF7546 family protein [Halobellus captivus]|uniref:DUF7546 family protein n=1 Tax=Halobellus captivus TaxID=2592614 RepID=UPI0011A9D6F7|nr:hypothetical protein [Halobellus captivus]
MSLSAAVSRSKRFSARSVRLAALVLLAEVVAVGTYLAVAEPEIDAVRYLVYPFVWMNVGLAATVRVQIPDADRRLRLLAGALAIGYFLALAFLSGLVGLEFRHSHAHAHVSGLQVTLAAPGWGPRIGYGGSLLTLNFVPYRVVGYLSLAFLVYAAALNASRRALSGVVGVASCVGCSLPLVESAAVGVVGGAAALAAVEPFSVDLSTLGFVLAAGLLSVSLGGSSR